MNKKTDIVLSVFPNGYSMGGVPPAAGILAVLPGDDSAVPFYYPGVVDAKSAQTVTLRPGDNVGGINISLSVLDTHLVRGRIVNPSTQSAASPRVQVQLLLRDPASSPFPSASLASVVADPKTGVFEFHGVLPGKYSLLANVGDGSLYGLTEIEAGNIDVDNVTIAVAPSLEIPVHAVIEGRLDDDPDVKGLRTVLNAVGRNPGSPAQPSPQPANGNFLLKNVMPGNYFIAVTKLPQDGYVKSIRAGIVDVLNDGIKIDNSFDGRIEVVVGANGGRLQGTALDEKRSPIANVTIAVVPNQSLQQRLDLYKNTSTDESGKFRISGLAPGDYKVFAWEDVESGAWQDPVFMRNYEDRGTPLHVIEAGEAIVQVTAIATGR